MYHTLPRSLQLQGQNQGLEVKAVPANEDCFHTEDTCAHLIDGRNYSTFLGGKEQTQNVERGVFSMGLGWVRRENMRTDAKF